jgi:pimeloyl-ACP methyl ester carboxylesterase
LLPIAVLSALYLIVAFAMVWGATRAERKPFEAHPADFGAPYEDVNFNSRGHDLRLEGWLLAGESGAPHLIFVHGIGGQRTADGALELASILARDSGYNVLVFDLRAHGTSDGDQVSGGYFEQDDVLGAYDFLRSRGAQPGRIGLLGFSMGAGIAIMAAADEPGIGAVIADSPFAEIGDLIAQETARKTPMPKAIVPGFLPAARVFADVFYGIDLGDLRPERDVSLLAYPVLVIHGEADERIPVSHGRRVAEKAPPGSEFWSLPRVDHVDAYLTMPEAYVERVVAYLASRFASAGLP